MSTATPAKWKPNDFKSELKPIWCPGCGDFGVLAALYRSMSELGCDPAKTVIVSGIGCSSYGLTKGQVSPTSLYDHKAPSTPYGNLEDPLNTLAFAVASGASFVARGASFNTKALTELISQAIEHPGFSYIDALSPCTTFYNTQEEWKQLVTDVAPDHDVTDRVKAFELALRGGFSLGILYKQERPTQIQRYEALLERAKPSDVDTMLNAFKARGGVAIGKGV